MMTPRQPEREAKGARQREATGAKEASADAAPRQTPLIDSQTLFASSKELQIVHEGEVYRLRRTRNGKLILTK